MKNNLKKQFSFSLIVAIAALLTISVPAKAETVMPNVKLAEGSLFAGFLSSQAFGTNIARQVAAYERSMGYTCDENYQVKLRGLRVIRPVVTVAEGPLMAAEGVPQPTGGLWFNRHVVSRCGGSVTYNSLVGVVNTGALKIRHLVLGTTGIHPLLIGGFRKRVAQMAQIEGCDAVVVTDTARGIPKGYTSANADSMHETWTVKGCDTKVRIVVLIEGKEDNTGFTLSAEDRQVLN